MENVPVRTDGPVAANRHAASGAPKGQRPHNGKQKKDKMKPIALAVAGLLLVAVIVLSGWFLYRSSINAYIDDNKYQAVFFTNGQVYFGKLDKLNGGYFKLTDIFYLQAQPDESGDTSEGSTNPQETANQQTPDVQLIKLGSEVHGPTDEMIMSKEQILFFENLKADGNVSETIEKYQNENK
ncbi:MAG TPA: hypothetical protein VFM68_03585 [Candidatus Saccharimonadales bacterium]|nr:hypothetical protein [Candidatus Saccharimonadales bacterium]